MQYRAVQFVHSRQICQMIYLSHYSIIITVFFKLWQIAQQLIYLCAVRWVVLSSDAVVSCRTPSVMGRTSPSVMGRTSFGCSSKEPDSSSAGDKGHTRSVIHHIIWVIIHSFSNCLSSKTYLPVSKAYMHLDWLCDCVFGMQLGLQPTFVRFLVHYNCGTIEVYRLDWIWLCLKTLIDLCPCNMITILQKFTDNLNEIQTSL